MLYKMLRFKSKNATLAVFLFSYHVVTLSKTKTKISRCFASFLSLSKPFCLVLENSTVLDVFTNHFNHNYPSFVNYRPIGAC